MFITKPQELQEKYLIKYSNLQDRKIQYLELWKMKNQSVGNTGANILHTKAMEWSTKPYTDKKAYEQSVDEVMKWVCYVPGSPSSFTTPSLCPPKKPHANHLEYHVYCKGLRTQKLVTRPKTTYTPCSQSWILEGRKIVQVMEGNSKETMLNNDVACLMGNAGPVGIF